MSVDQIEDVEVLRRMVKLHYQENQRIKAQLSDALAKLHDKNSTEAEQLALKLDEIEKKYAATLKKIFGQTTERRPETGESKGREKPQRGHGRKQQPELPIEEVVHELDADEARCPVCQGDLEAWQDNFEESLEVDFIEPRVVFKKHLRQKYRCTCGACIKTAPGPKKLFPKARYSIDFAINVALKKYCYHLPLDRQRRELKRLGLDATTATLWDYLSVLYGLLEPAYQRLSEHVLSQPVIGADETSWRLLKSEKKGKSKTWWVWARRCDDAVHYTLNPSRGSKVAAELFDGYEGTVICDGYVAYESLLNSNPNVKLANCWSHARRELLLHEGDPMADRAIRVIRRLYRLEAIADDKPPDELLKWRQRKTKPLLDAFFKWIAEQKIAPSNSLRNAMRYIQVREKTLKRFLDDPNIDPDNNATERALRGVVVGRKNH